MNWEAIKNFFTTAGVDLLRGIIVVALITSIIVNFYGEMKKTGNDETDPVPEAEQKAEGNGNSLPEETAETDPA